MFELLKLWIVTWKEKRFKKIFVKFLQKKLWLEWKGHEIIYCSLFICFFQFLVNLENVVGFLNFEPWILFLLFYNRFTQFSLLHSPLCKHEFHSNWILKNVWKAKKSSNSLFMSLTDEKSRFQNVFFCCLRHHQKSHLSNYFGPWGLQDVLRCQKEYWVDF